MRRAGCSTSGRPRTSAGASDISPGRPTEEGAQAPGAGEGRGADHLGGRRVSARRGARGDPAHPGAAAAAERGERVPVPLPVRGRRADGDETYFCLTTSPEAFPAFMFHGAFRSREITREAFFRLVDLLRYVGHPVPRHRCRRLGSARHSPVRVPPAARGAARRRGPGSCAGPRARCWRRSRSAWSITRAPGPGARRPTGPSGRSGASSGTRPGPGPGADRHRLRALSRPPARARPPLRPLPGRGPDLTGLVRRRARFVTR